MLSRNGCYAKTSNVVLRRFDEWGRCYAFTPDEPEIYDLNTTAWFIVELCDGRPFQQIEADYLAVLGPKVGRDKANSQFHAGFDTLLQRNIISVTE
ncbi:MAG: hypothetical protein KJZ80_10930 [Hyphomicrobiaceae bacterium]|nr:hypothetical protein [Hyphomicrobiaceae bacterium]